MTISPHFYRNISRIIIITVILSFFALAVVAESNNSGTDVKGVSNINRDEVNLEIDNTLSVIKARPDYAGAWIRLSVLYEQIGQSDLAKKAMEAAKRLNPDL